MKHFTSLTLTALAILLLSGCGSAPVTQIDPSKPMEVVASFYPLAHFAKQVGKNLVSVSTVVPNGTEPHDYEPTAGDITKIRGAHAFFFIGGGFEPWAEKIEGGVAMGAHLNLHEFDPHIWLDPLLAKRQVEIIRDTFIEKDPGHKEEYVRNAARYAKELDELDAEFRQKLTSCRSNYAIVSHDAFGYLTRRYGLNLTAISGLSPHEEPSPKRLAELAIMAREKNIQYIFFETLTSPRLAETLAQEIGAQTLVLNPIEGLSEEEIANEKDYLSIMRENLKNLEVAFHCQ